MRITLVQTRSYLGASFLCKKIDEKGITTLTWLITHFNLDFMNLLLLLNH